MATIEGQSGTILRAALLGVVGLLLIPAGIYVPSSPWMKQEKALTAARDQLITLQTRAARLRAEETQLPSLQRQVREMQGELAAFNQTLPNGKQADDFIRALERLAAASGVHIKRITSKPVMQEQYHSDLPFEVEAEGTYAGMLNFFGEISRLPRITNMGDVALSGFADATSRPKNAPANATVDATFSIVTYFTGRPDAAPQATTQLASRTSPAAVTR